ncbi:tRNA (adenosine(37)-N6)-dimethylallyltransferase MiaA [Patescibacteria group bacterium]|nr:tRNA (adenosine(37)-N6)-dimethylallyltransferase MiaA [Patescibacteria group bacterium]MBU2579779.1 tRNA (adenosine(37)-N6)-dimethylallyltransferase MiaA [Patescibacteria group bacterium]
MSSKYSQNKLIVILGPTASGKTSLAIKLAKIFSGEIVSADSRQVYREMDIGTDKIVPEGIPHHLIDVVNPDEKFTLAQYKKMAIKAIKDIQKRGNVPFLVGGTGLYIQSIVDNLQIPKGESDAKMRNKLEKMENAELFEKLKKLDPVCAAAIDSKNKRRLVRAVEVCLATGKPFSQQRKKGKPLFDVLQIGIKPDKEKLEKKIAQRADQMIQTGLIEEVKGLIKRYGSKIISMDSIGYQEIIAHLQNKITLEEAKDLVKTHTRQYAKRQMTWFKRDKRIQWIENYSQAKKLIGNFLL